MGAPTANTTRSTMSLPRSSYLCVLLLLLAVIATHQSDVDANDGSQPPLTPTYTSMSANGNVNGQMIPLSQQGGDDNPLRQKDDARSSALLDNNDLEQQNPLDYQSPWLQPPSWAAKHGCTPIRWALAVGVVVGVVIGSVLVWFFTSDKETSHAAATTLAPTTAAPTTPKSLAPTTPAPTTPAPTTHAPTPAPTAAPLCSARQSAQQSVECRAWQDFFDDTCEGRDCKEFGGGICRGSGREDPCKCDKVKCEDGHIIELNMREAGLLGSLPNSIGALTALQKLDCTEITNLRGTLPESITALTALTFMSFSITEQISGTLPEAIGELTALITMTASGQSQYGEDKTPFSGTLPNSITALTLLNTLIFSDTYVEGTIPEGIGALTALSTLRFDRTHISGSIPQSFCGLHKFNPNQGCLLSYNQYGSVANNYLCPLPTCANVAACGVTTCSTPAPSPA